MDIHSVTVHGLAHENVVVVVVTEDLLNSGGGTGLELIDLLLRGTLLGKLGEDLLHVDLNIVSKDPRIAHMRSYDELTLEVLLEGILGRLHALLGLEPDELELIFDVVDHDGLTLTTLIVGLLSRGIGTLKLEVLVLALEVLLAVALPEDGAGLLDLEGIGEELVAGDEVLYCNTC